MHRHSVVADSQVCLSEQAAAEFATKPKTKLQKTRALDLASPSSQTRHEDPFVVIKNRVYNDTLVCEPPTQYVCQQPAMPQRRSLSATLTAKH